MVTIGNGTKKLFSKETGTSSFLKLSLLLQRKKAYALPNVVHYKFSLFHKSRKYRVETVVYNCNKTSVAKVSLCCYLVWFAIKFCFVLDTYDTDAIAINKRCKLNFWYFTMYLAISHQQGFQGLLKWCLLFLRL